MATMPRGDPRSVPDVAGEAYDAMLGRFRLAQNRIETASAVRRPQGTVARQPILTGSPGVAAAVAAAVNAITAGPNTSSGFRTKNTDVNLRRGAGADIYGSATYKKAHIGVAGQLDPPSGRREIRVSGLRADTPVVNIRTPRSVRLFNTNDNELRYELTSPFQVDLLRVPILKIRAGQYVIGSEH